MGFTFPDDIAEGKSSLSVLSNLTALIDDHFFLIAECQGRFQCSLCSEAEPLVVYLKDSTNQPERAAEVVTYPDREKAQC